MARCPDWVWSGPGLDTDNYLKVGTNVTRSHDNMIIRETGPSSHLDLLPTWIMQGNLEFSNKCSDSTYFYWIQLGHIRDDFITPVNTLQGSSVIGRTSIIVLTRPVNNFIIKNLTDVDPSNDSDDQFLHHSFDDLKLNTSMTHCKDEANDEDDKEEEREDETRNVDC